VYIPKPDGRQRPLGIAALEDKMVQQAVVTVLNAIYETDFRGFSYGFRPGRNAHEALDALNAGLPNKRVNWILDADIKGFFDHVSHEWLLKFMGHRVADNRVLRLIQKWLKAGVSEEGEWSETTVGTPQGAVASPLLANVYLHYVFDLWAEKWREKVAQGDVIIVRYADDLVAGFQHQADAERFLRDFRERLAKFGLEIHPEKTRLIAFGRLAASDCRKRGKGKPETFAFLGFTHYCGRNSKGHFVVWRRTVAKRMRAKLHAIKQELRRKMHEPVAHVGAWLKRVVDGYYRYHAVPGTWLCSGVFESGFAGTGGTFYVVEVSGGSPTGNNCGLSLIAGFLVHVLFILILMFASTLASQGGAVCGNSARSDLCGGGPAMAIPTAIPIED
jgi:group II intron reverse transcriptase/maturase